MTKEEAILRLKECQKNNDTEAAHVYADDVLCGLLKGLGLLTVNTYSNKI